ncbi:PAS domain-containing protein [Neomoorella humiferrea]|uniref:PAS domain-containing protein n=1 Tax=Neomoorella humiferrea TaxID=676965 RepID=UPI000D044931|nr:PAS domain S-box protein [Moorella humiferrea]
MGKTLHSWNKGAEEFFGYTAEEIIGRPLTLFFPPEGKDEADALLTRIAAGEEPGNYDALRLAKDGRKVFVSITVSSVKNENRKILGASVIARDISDLRGSASNDRQAQLSWWI